MGLFFLLGISSSASHIHETKASNYMHPEKGKWKKKKNHPTMNIICTMFSWENPSPNNETNNQKLNAVEKLK